MDRSTDVSREEEPMTERTATLEGLASAWQSDLEVLHYWGHEDQARIVSRCHDKLTAQLEGRQPHDRVQAGTMLRLWSSDAEVLEAYGHPEEAAALRRCVSELRRTVCGAAREPAPDVAREEGPRPPLRGPELPTPYRPRSRESAPGGPE